jgi:hypothetical protein
MPLAIKLCLAGAIFGVLSGLVFSIWERNPVGESLSFMLILAVGGFLTAGLASAALYTLFYMVGGLLTLPFP